MYEAQRFSADRKTRWSPDAIIKRAIIDFLPTQKLGAVLDYGAGNSPYRKYINCDRYISADLTQNITNKIDYLIEPNTPLELVGGSFDCILLLDVLEHIDDPRFTFSEMRRLLKPGGSVYLSVPFIYREHETPNDYVRYTSFGICSLISNQGGQVLQMRKVGNLFFTLVSLWLERGIENGEHVTLGIYGRLINRLSLFFLRFFEGMLAITPSQSAGIYHHLLLEARF